MAVSHAKAWATVTLFVLRVFLGPSSWIWWHSCPTLCGLTLTNEKIGFCGTERPEWKNMDRRDLRSQSLDLLRFPLAVVILTVHTFNSNGFLMQGTPISLDNMPFLLELNHLIGGFLRGQSVPIYYFISGYVFFLGVKLTREKYVQKLKNRVKTLLIPYLIWNAVAASIPLLGRLPFLASIFPNNHDHQFNFSPSAILETFWDNSKGILAGHTDTMQSSADSLAIATFPADTPLWFVRDLMIVVLCAPLLYWILKRTRHWFIMLLGVLWFTLPYFGIELGRYAQLSTAFFFFSWGAYMSVNTKDMMYEFNRFFKPSIVGYPLLALLHVASVHYCPDLSATIKSLNAIVGLFFAYNLASWLLTRKICKVSRLLAASSFFIYVSHDIVNVYVLKVLYILFHPTGEFGMTMIYVLTVITTTMMLLLTFYLMRRYTPGLLKVVAGRK